MRRPGDERDHDCAEATTKVIAIGYTIRTFLITPDEGILKMGMTRYWNMLGAPDSHRLPEFSD
jgi:hypothetical protein